MHSVACRLGVRIPRGKEGLVGKAIKKLYESKYGEGAASRIPKRNVPFKGQIFAENAYWQRVCRTVGTSDRVSCKAGITT